MKKKVFLLVVSILLMTCLVKAEINTQVNLYNFDKDFEKIPSEDITIKYGFDSSEEIVKDLGSDSDSLILENELFCYKGCNIVPERKMNRIEIYWKNEMVSRQDAYIKDDNTSQIINIYIGEKIGVKGNQEPESIGISYLSEELLIEWNGFLDIYSKTDYDFSFESLGAVKLYIDEELVLDDWTRRNYLRGFRKNLGNGTYRIKIIYTALKTEKPGLIINQVSGTGISNQLRFDSGKIESGQVLRTKAFPETYNPDYTTYPTVYKKYHSKISGRTPLLLVHGLHGSNYLPDINNPATWDYWNEIPAELRNRGIDVWEMYFYPANSSTYFYSGILKNEINHILSYPEYQDKKKIDIIGYSMGGLVVLAYIQNFGIDRYGNPVEYDNNLRKVLFLTPTLHGAHIVNRGLMKMSMYSNSYCSFVGEWFNMIIQDLEAQAYLDISVGSELTFLLAKKELNPNITYLSALGGMGMICVPDETNEYDYPPGNDGLVAATSASLLDKDIPLIVLNNYDHETFHGTFAGFSYSVPEEINLIELFFKDASKEQIASYINTIGFYIDNKDYSNPFSKGSVLIKVNSVSTIGSVKLVNKNTRVTYNLREFKDLRHNTKTNIWYYFSNNDINLPDNNPMYGLSFPQGEYDIIIDDIDTKEDIIIKPAETSISEITFYQCDSDKDGYASDFYLCKGDDCNDNDNKINTNTTEICDFIDNNCNGIIDEGCVVSFCNPVCSQSYTPWIKKCRVDDINIDCTLECVLNGRCINYNKNLSVNTSYYWEGDLYRGFWFNSSSIFFDSDSCYYQKGFSQFTPLAFGSASSYIIKNNMDNSLNQACFNYPKTGYLETNLKLFGRGDDKNHNINSMVYDYGYSNCGGSAPWINDLNGILYSGIMVQIGNFTYSDRYYSTCNTPEIIGVDIRGFYFDENLNCEISAKGSSDIDKMIVQWYVNENLVKTEECSTNCDFVSAKLLRNTFILDKSYTKANDIVYCKAKALGKDNGISHVRQDKAYIRNYECSDGIDNDLDGKIDLNDPGCKSSDDTREQDPACYTNLDCNDDNSCTNDICSSETCSNEQIILCKNNDGCCPGICDFYADNDCKREKSIITNIGADKTGILKIGIERLNSTTNQWVFFKEYVNQNKNLRTGESFNLSEIWNPLTISINKTDISATLARFRIYVRYLSGNQEKTNYSSEFIVK